MRDFSHNPFSNAVLQPRIYVKDGELPGEPFAEGEPADLYPDDLYEPGSLYAPFTFKFPEGVYLPDDNEYNISVKAMSFAGVSRYSCPNFCMPILYGNHNFFGNDIRCASTSVPAWYQYKGRALAGTIGAIGTKPLAEREIRRDCSGCTVFTFWAKSDVPGNVINFVYGADAGNIKTVPIEIAQPDEWERITVDISDEAEKASLGYYAVKLGLDVFDPDTLATVPNTVYVDDLGGE